MLARMPHRSHWIKWYALRIRNTHTHAQAHALVLSAGSTCSQGTNSEIPAFLTQVDTIMDQRARRPPLVSSDTLWQDFGAGESVLVHGLTKAPEYNGRCGVIERWEGDRFVVKLEGKSKGVKIKPENLKPLRSTESDASAGSQDKVGQDGVGHQAFTGLVRER